MRRLRSAASVSIVMSPFLSSATLPSLDEVKSFGHSARRISIAARSCTSSLYLPGKPRAFSVFLMSETVRETVRLASARFL